MNDKTPSTSDLVADYLAKGGKITKCPPGEAENALTVERWRLRDIESVIVRAQVEERFEKGGFSIRRTP